MKDVAARSMEPELGAAAPSLVHDDAVGSSAAGGRNRAAEALSGRLDCSARSSAAPQLQHRVVTKSSSFSLRDGVPHDCVHICMPHYSNMARNSMFVPLADSRKKECVRTVQFYYYWMPTTGAEARGQSKCELVFVIIVYIAHWPALGALGARRGQSGLSVAAAS